MSQASQADREPKAFDRRAIPNAATEARWTLPDGQAIRRIDWPGAAENPRGSVLFLPGRGDHYEKYLEALDHWHRQGWRVTAADWRGQGASGRLGTDPTTGHVQDFANWIDDLAAFWNEWKAGNPGPYVLMGHSMGGHLVLRALAEGRVDPDALVLSAPMLAFYGSAIPAFALHGAARLMTRIGDPRRPAWKWSEKPGEMPAARANLLTHDRDRYEDEIWWRTERPELVMGPGSWGWVERAFASMRSLFRPGVLEGIRTPVFLFGTSNDKLVDMAAIRVAAHRIPDAELLEFGDEAHHEILREADPVRDSAIEAIDAFLDRTAPPE
ncbi:alpha/beta hydrolase [Qipengyuania sp. JC766]|uniref:alpha/beta hydrolase n=1 Tax=Qipengyuania sp. JC766 TaxID=3232139 RepID=UPI00345A256A